MIREIAFTVPGAATGKGRPRMTRAGRVYTPGPTVRAETRVRDYAEQVMRRSDCRLPPTAAPCTLTVVIGVEWPRSSWLKREPRPGGVPAPGRPDVDNVVKLVSDALKGVIWLDDAQVWQVMAQKIRVPQGEAGFIGVTVTWEEPLA